MQNETVEPRWLSDSQVGSRYGVSRITIWRWSKEIEQFPKPRKLGANTSRWNTAELDEYDRQRMAAA